MRRGWYLNHRIILAICFIIFTSLANFSCSSIQSVRSGNFNVGNRYKEKDEKISILKEPTSFSVVPGLQETKFEHQSLQYTHFNDFHPNNNTSSGEDELKKQRTQEHTNREYEDLERKIQNLEEEIELLRNEIKELVSVLLAKELNQENKGYPSQENQKNDYEKKKEDKISKKHQSKKNENNRHFQSSKQAKLPSTGTEKSKVEEKTKQLEVTERILSLFKEKRYEEAINYLNALINEETSDSQLSLFYYWRGEARFQKRNYQEALEDFIKSRSFKESPKKIESHIMIAECYAKIGKSSEAKKEYKKFIEEYPFSEFTPRAKRMIQQL
ncbi:MAG: tetratricopeptide repeat protein [Ignavibacteria bacterium]|nr:tetratricopeptide repeat protein [Ignavibacteria bacterium]